MVKFSRSDRMFMQRALELARLGIGNTRPNPSVGAVIVSETGQVIGEGWHRKAGQPHAEIEALNDAAIKENPTRNAIMYVTLEPCNHHGRTGPCSEAIIKAGIQRVVIAQKDPNPVAAGGIQRLQDAGIHVDVGLFEDEAIRINPGFNTVFMLGRPLVTLKWAMTLDGCTSMASGDSKWVTNPSARHRVQRDRAAHDGILAGIKTVITDDSRLSVRDVPEPEGPPLCRFVLDSRLNLPLKSAFLKDRRGRPIIVCSETASKSRIEVLQEMGEEIWVLPAFGDNICLRSLLEKMVEEKIQSLFVEGGRTVAGEFLGAGFVDRIQAWIAPKIAGGGPVPLNPIISSNPKSKMKEATYLHSVKLEEIEGDYRLEGWLSRHLFPKLAKGKESGDDSSEPGD